MCLYIEDCRKVRFKRHGIQKKREKAVGFVEKPVGNVDNYMHKRGVENLSDPHFRWKSLPKKIVHFYKTVLFFVFSIYFNIFLYYIYMFTKYPYISQFELDIIMM